MESTSTQKNQSTKTTFNAAKFPPVELSRKFSAPVERVWKAWADPELVKQWWGPETYTCPSAKLDVRPGGKSILAMKGPDGKVQYSGGVYSEVVPNKKIVSTDQFMDKDGNYMSPKDAGMPGQWGDRMEVTVDFKSLDANESEIKISHQGIPAEMHDDCVQGWSSSIDKLQRLVEHS